MELMSPGRRGTRPPRIEPRVSSKLEAICRKCLEYEPSDRYQNARELIVDLDRFLAGSTRHARLSSEQLRPAEA
jgi:hypothetical protein